MNDSTFPATVHHIALTLTDVDASRDWYRALLGADPAIDEAVPAHRSPFWLPPHHLRADRRHRPGPARAPGHRAGRPVRRGPPGAGPHRIRLRRPRRLERLAARLDGLAVKHSGIADDALGHGLSFRDPDGIALEFWAPRS